MMAEKPRTSVNVKQRPSVQGGKAHGSATWEREKAPHTQLRHAHEKAPMPTLRSMPETIRLNSVQKFPDDQRDLQCDYE